MPFFGEGAQERAEDPGGLGIEAAELEACFLEGNSFEVFVQAKGAIPARKCPFEVMTEARAMQHDASTSLRKRRSCIRLAQAGGWPLKSGLPGACRRARKQA